MALTSALCASLPVVTGITNKSLRASMTGLLTIPYRAGQTTYGLRRLRLNGIVRTHRNREIRTVIFYTKTHNRLLIPCFAADQPQGPPELAAALKIISRHVDHYLDEARLSPSPSRLDTSVQEPRDQGSLG